MAKRFGVTVDCADPLAVEEVLLLGLKDKQVRDDDFGSNPAGGLMAQ